jgi:fructokinase
MESTDIRLGVDLGGTKIEIVALDDRGTELLRRRVATPRNDYPATLHAVAALVGAAERELGVRCSVGVGAPGALSTASGNLKNSNSTWLNDRPLKQDLERALGREVRLANDANCFALSEAVDGAGEGRDVVFGVILGTGVGGGIVVRHHVLTGANAIAGEWGHNPLPFPRPEDQPAPPCYCGQHGCVETYLSGPGMARNHIQHGGQELDARAIVASAASGDAVCAVTVARYEERLARALAQVINLLDPDIIVLGGGMSNIDSLYKNVPKFWTPFIFSDHVATPLVRNLHGDSSGVRGAAWLWS